ncbi:MAG TPA: 3-hydroxyacyl-CoA dehydrogenase family protein, partial [Verrucomicrobiae bacterium]|nr:3-hydroxyacyl-CoA dehydrogenase family protein [Verrucomicrobiae bacterium]
GFYVYEKSGPRPNPKAAAFVQNQSSAGFSREELQERMVLLMIIESARCLEEQIVAEPADVDFAMVTGIGFAPFRGGPLRYADSLGAEKLVGAMEFLVDAGAEYFAPPGLLKQVAATKKTFYAR